MSETSQASSKMKLGGQGGGKNMDYLFAAALILVIVVSLVLTIKFSSGGPNNVVDIDLRFQCQQCGHEFFITPDEVWAQKSGSGGGPGMPGAMGPGVVRAIDCPECGTKDSCIQMVQCPNPDCKKYFLAESSDVCPHCGVDRMQWHREEAKNCYIRNRIRGTCSCSSFRGPRLLCAHLDPRCRQGKADYPLFGKMTSTHGFDHHSHRP